MNQVGDGNGSLWNQHSGSCWMQLYGIGPHNHRRQACSLLRKGWWQTLSGSGALLLALCCEMPNILEHSNERLIIARSKTRRAKITITMSFAPTKAAEAGVKNTFYYQLECILDNVPSSDAIILLRDKNAKVDSHIEGDGSVAGSHGLGNRNDSGTRFVDCCERHGWFPHKWVHKSTWMSPDSVTMNQIDHIAISIKHWVFLKDVGTFRGADIGLTDHYLLRAKLRMKVSKASNIQPPQLYDTKKN